MVKWRLLVPAIENGEGFCIRVCFTFFQVTQIIIGLGRMIYHIKALSAVIHTT